MHTKPLFIITLFLIMALNSFSQDIGSFTDSRDGKSYKTIKIGTQTWMAENLAYQAKVGCVPYENDESKVSQYGYLYNWKTACDACPDGWRLPADQEWQTLELFLGMNKDEFEYTSKRAENIGTRLKSMTGWYNKGNGDNSSGFNAIPAGACLFYDNSFQFLNEYAYFWTCSPLENDAWARVLKYDDTYIERGVFSKNNSLSVRCVKK